ncbi:MAG: ribonuclease III [Myxococcaceae bacterium]|nr:ribonuclease III [Myxococcaceae bacterium]MCI0671040.1 ribonuclease III [Myxococcaceae bacterium]
MAGHRLNAAERVRSLEGRLHVRFEDEGLALSSLTHKSYVNEHPGEVPSDNERLEFLGDAVVDLAISHRLMERFPLATEGELSKLRALIVNEEGLARVARVVRLGELLLLGKGEERTGGREKASVLADALEAVIGALYLSGGLPSALALVDRLFTDTLEGVAQGRSGTDFKTRLQEDAQLRLKQSPRYRVVAESGPEHAKTFEVEVTIGSTVSARASGRSKKEAEQAAARDALQMLNASHSGP